MNYIVPKHIKPDTIFIVNRSELEGRLEPEYYKPSIVKLENRIRKNASKKLKDFILKMGSGATPLIADEEKYYADAKTGIPFLRVQNLQTNGQLALDDVKYINEETHKKSLKRSQVAENDLLVKITGVGRMAIASVPYIKFIGNTNQHLVVIKTDNRNTSEYLANYLNLDIVEKLATRRSTGGTRPALDYTALKSLPIIEGIDFGIIENAEKLKLQKEAEANTLLQSIDSYLLQELDITLPPQNTSIESRIFNVNFSEVTGSRLDPFYYITEFKTIESKINKSKWDVFSLNELFQINRGGSPRPIDKYITDDEKGINWIKIGDTKNDDKYIFTTSQKIIPEGVKSSRMVYEGDFILSNSMSFGRPYIMKTSGCIHDGWLLFRPKIKDFNQDFFHTILSSGLIYRLFKKATIGGVVENLNINLVKKIKIPLPPKEMQTKIANHILSIRKQANQLKAQAQSIIENAKAEVEKMILK